MTRTPSMIVMTGLGLLMTGCANAPDAEVVALGAADLRGGDEVVTLDECPAAVQATILAYVDGGVVQELERTTDHGEVLYEVDAASASGVVEFDVAEDGTFRGYENDDDDEDNDDDD